MIKLYGIANCNTVKKARLWLKAQGIDAEFIDFKKIPPTKQDIQFWLTHLPKETLINRKGTTWRKLTQTEQQQAFMSDEEAIEIMLTHPSIIKRPVLIVDDTVTAGFNEQHYADLFTPLLKK
ncbi:Spx/MgsR family RNA polymerase-binding regulatory protein [Neisseriaceae bacterium ESL0693]|nr:Spx/MgsR family RNA polymerase-binding regulatory protein [Neisseriaceae bacterium ESL0693]